MAMNKIKNNKGSTLILVIFVLAILSTVGTALLGVTLTNFKMKTINTKAKQNFYLSEAGLEEVYSKVYNLIDSSFEAGNTAALNLVNSFNYDEELMKEIMGTDSPYIKIEDGNYNVDEDNIDIMMNTEFKNVFSNSIETNILDTINSDIDIEHDLTSPVIEAITTNPQFVEDTMEVDIKSTFLLNNVERKTLVTLEINIPEFNEPYYIEKKAVEISYNPVWTKALAANGNIYIKSGANYIRGDIYTKGQDSEGIIIENSYDLLDVNGDIMTHNNITLKNSDLNVYFRSNVYTKNLLLSESANNSTLNIEDSVYTDDDLEINGLGQVVNIDDSYYGFSDGSESPYHDQSSSIIINSNDLGDPGGTLLTIDGEVLIYGTSFIDTYDGKYQTGESLSIKGNYIAYTKPLYTQGVREGLESLRNDNVSFTYMNPLVLVDSYKIGTSLNCFDKSDYFSFYDTEYSTSSGINLGNGIVLDESENITHTGIIVYNGKISESNVLVEDQSLFNEKRDKFECMTKQMGDNTIPVEDTTVSQQIDYDSITEIDKDVDINNEFIYITNNTNDVALIGENGNSDLGIKKINLNQGYVYRGVIITKGDVYITGDFTLNGTIITDGDIYVYTENTTNIYYNENYVLKTIYDNSLKLIFRNNSYLNYALYVYDVIYSNELGNINMRPDDMLEFKNWQISYN